jgi:type I restriction enzyme S subunit
MMTKPQIRFAGFADAWEQRKLGDVAKITMGQSPKGENYTENPNNPILVQGNADMKNGRVVPRVWTTQITKTADRGDLILSVRAPVGDVGKTDYNVVLGRGVAAIKGNEFVFQCLGRMKDFGYWSKLSTGSTFESINSDIIKDAIIYTPSELEQTQIGTFLTALDHLITLHQREYGKTINIKKAMLEKMFPKDGENKPEIRFVGFTDAWEQRRLGDLGSVSTGNTPPTSEKENWADDNGGYVWITPTDIDAFIMSDSERHLTASGWGKARTVPAYSVLITSIASIGKNAVNTVSAAFNQQINAIVPKENNAYFILSAMEKEKVRFAGMAGQTATAIINKTEFEKFTLSVPTIQEQKQIGQLFANLDHLITLHQRELVKLQNMKKALLEMMFV